MSSVRISVDGGFLGDVTVTLDEPVGSWDADREKRAIDRLLNTACRKIRDAYRIGSDS